MGNKETNTEPVKEKDETAINTNQLSGRTIILKSGIIWKTDESIPENILLSAIKDNEGKVANKFTLPKVISSKLQRYIQNSLDMGILAIVENLTDDEKKRLETIEEVDINREDRAETMEFIDELLNMDESYFIEELQVLSGKGRGRSFFVTLLAEETTGKKRSAFMDAISKYI